MKKTLLLLILIALFVTSEIINYLIWSHFEISMGAENAKSVRKLIIQVHSVLLAVLMGGLFAKPSKEERIKLPLAVTSIGFSVIWVVYISLIWNGYPISISANGSNGLIDQFTDRSTELSTVVSGVLAYLCRKEESTEGSVASAEG